MLPGNTILFHWKKEQKVFEQTLALLRKKTDKEAIHDLRVVIKKLRAWEKLFRLLRPGAVPLPQKDDTFIPLTTAFFDITGRQRDVEITLDILKSLQNETGYQYKQLHYYLQSVLKITRALTNVAIHQYRIRELAAMARLLQEDSAISDATALDKKILPVIGKQLKTVSLHFQQPHTLRKQLKTIYYWLIFPENKEKYSPGLLHTILDELGYWQDLEIAAIRIKHFRKDYMPKPLKEYGELKKLEVLIQSKKKALLVEVRKNLKIWRKEVAKKSRN